MLTKLPRHVTSCQVIHIHKMTSLHNVALCLSRLNEGVAAAVDDLQQLPGNLADVDILPLDVGRQSGAEEEVLEQRGAELKVWGENLL